MQDIPQLEKFIMDGLFWSDMPVLQTINPHEGLCPALREKVVEMLTAALPPMDAYLALYDTYLPIVQMDLPSHMAEYSSPLGSP